MQRKKPDVDVVKDVLELALKAMPHSSFLQSLHQQYLERGGLSKKQLEGLMKKAAKVQGMPSARLATLEALVLRKPTRFRSAAPPPRPLFNKNEMHGSMLQDILERYPHHKQVLLLKAKYDRNQPLTAPEENELKKFHQLLIK